MSDTNGQTNGAPKVLSLEQARTKGTRKGNDFITVQQAYDMVIQECAKVHEYYLTQIPTFVARMIQDALLSYSLIVPQPGVDIAPAGATAVSDSTAPVALMTEDGTPLENLDGTPFTGTNAEREVNMAPPVDPAA